MGGFSLRPEHVEVLEKGEALFVEHLLGEHGALACFQGLQTLAPQLVPARVGHAGITRVDPTVRSDRVLFLRPGDTVPDGLHRLFAWFAALGRALSAATGDELSGFEVQVACYPADGGHYTRHLDADVFRSRRRYTALYYPEPGRRVEHGGALRLYTNAGAREVIPGNDRAVVFRADEVFHEVLPAFRERWAVTAWFLVPEPSPPPPGF